VELAVTVANRKVLASNVNHLDTASKGHNDRGG